MTGRALNLVLKSVMRNDELGNVIHGLRIDLLVEVSETPFFFPLDRLESFESTKIAKPGLNFSLLGITHKKN